MNNIHPALQSFDMRQLRAFAALARDKNFTKAAASLSLTQSAVSHSLKSLETTIGYPLFNRVGRAIKLTPAGDILLRHVQHIFRQIEEASTELQQYHKPGHGTLRVGCASSMSAYLLPEALCEFRGSFPNCQVTVITADTPSLIKELGKGELDIAVGVHIKPERQKTHPCFRSIFKDQLGLLMHPKHQHHHEQDALGTLGKQTFIFYSRYSETYQLCYEYFKQAQISWPRSLEVGSMEGIREMVLSGNGIGVTAPWIALEEIKNDRLHFLPMSEEFPLEREWGVYFLNDGQLPMAQEVFIQLLQNKAAILTGEQDFILKSKLAERGQSALLN